MRRITLPCDDRPDNQPATLEKGKGKIQQWQVPSFSTVTTPIRSFLCSSSPPPVAFAHSDPPLGAHRCICDKSGEPAELHSGHGHGAQIHRWSNVCRSQGLHKHHPLLGESRSVPLFTSYTGSCQPWHLWHFQAAKFYSALCLS